jgi:hypothetical protein
MEVFGISIVDFTVIVAVAICTASFVWTMRKIGKQQPNNPERKEKNERKEDLENDLEKVFG